MIELSQDGGNERAVFRIPAECWRKGKITKNQLDEFIKHKVSLRLQELKPPYHKVEYNFLAPGTVHTDPLPQDGFIGYNLTWSMYASL